MISAGIVGGIGPESTVDYYRAILASCRRRAPDAPAPSLIINSIDLDHALSLLNEGRVDALTAYLIPEIERLAAAGATFGLLAANTPHLVFDALSAQVSLPLVSIVEATREEASRLGMTRVGLLGTRFTMAGTFRPETRARILAVIGRLVADEGIDGVILGGTELPLLLRGHDVASAPFLDTTLLHVEAVVTRLLAGEGSRHA